MMNKNEWKKVKLGDVFELQIGRTPSRNNKNYWDNGSNNWISISDIKENEKFAEVIVPDDQLSLAIGKSGQNARLAAKLTNWKIDIKSESQYREFLEQNAKNEEDGNE